MMIQASEQTKHCIQSEQQQHTNIHKISSIKGYRNGINIHVFTTTSNMNTKHGQTDKILCPMYFCTGWCCKVCHPYNLLITKMNELYSTNMTNMRIIIINIILISSSVVPSAVSLVWETRELKSSIRNYKLHYSITETRHRNYIPCLASGDIVHQSCRIPCVAV